MIGAGVAGLQAIATARRLGAVVEAYDVRSATREQVKSLGAKFVETGVSAEGAGGYARELTAEEKAKQQEVLDARIAAADAVITTAAVPGRAAPRIISQGGGGAHAARLRDRRHRRRAGRQLRAHAAPARPSITTACSIIGPLNLPAQLAYTRARCTRATCSTS